MKSLSIQLDPVAVKLSVDGNEIADINALQITWERGTVPQVVLALPAGEIDAEGFGEVVVQSSASVLDFLTSIDPAELEAATIEKGFNRPFGEAALEILKERAHAGD